MNAKIIVGDALAHTKGLIVHGCNTQGVMGSGIAKTVKERYPTAFNAYYKQFKTGGNYEAPGQTSSSGLVLGTVIPVEVEDNKWIINAMTQHLYGPGIRRVSYDAVTECFEKIVSYARRVEEVRKFKPDIVYPLIGAGLGGGNWHIISKIIDETINNEFPQIIYGFEKDLRVWGLID